MTPVSRDRPRNGSGAFSSPQQKGFLLVTVYAKEGCNPCKLTKNALTRKGVDYVEKWVDQDPIALAEIKELGYLQVPVVRTEDDHWSGLRPDKLDLL